MVLRGASERACRGSSRPVDLSRRYTVFSLCLVRALAALLEEAMCEYYIPLPITVDSRRKQPNVREENK